MTVKIYVEGYGCTLNSADTTIIENSIKEFKDFQIIDKDEDADIVVINTCIVRLETEHKMISRIKYLRSLNKKVVVAGCMAKALREKLEGISDILIMPKEAHLSGKMLHNLFNERIEKEIIPKDRNKNKIGKIGIDSNNLNDKLKYLKPSKNSIIVPLPICEGCVGKCSYCIVKVARGRLISYDREFIVKKADELIKNGAKCLLVTAQDTACYGFDRNDNLPNLINDLCSIEGKFGMRIGMMHAKNALEILDELVESYKNDKVTKFLHLPIQSGDDGVLKDMKREYTVDEFISVISEFRRKIKNLNFTTDVIVGFPTETEEAFENTLEILKKLKPDYTHGAKYTQRKYTEAARLKQVDTKIRKRRSEILNELRRELSYENNKKHIGEKFEILVTGKNEGITENCKPVKFNEDAEIGTFRTIKITEAKTFGLFGELK
ncbi:MAG: threonylcarbamoyladenosine tRNA methylthiotransferase [Methanothermococcus sp.]|jgi:MiaB-like tRNA modifying enzyme|uniref:tRNA (N(6)-L-threonylcarbamoyladenosine(37)-C(2))- methylthiotransferase n=1 Tax=Methanothermococcus TaxID=155862 RepID=UPI000367F0F8|nr:MULTISPECIES: tRNA (N(6)-L-threonylcarbamoyladenosine(37)-C(2))-methylthiotransferase [Methanothermococcus]MDK2790464.1 threonylcarbamoyladenosine tRNA methylthiotransferase [Methanothermococcus sp.]MDK2987742.1 threonylcarbamoyladenosine tRNA methylthiotransferase [Methanothermococcus sp.]